jgi:hypothetical protein
MTPAIAKYVPALLLLRDVRTIGVEHDVLRSRREGDEDREHGEKADLLARRAHGHRGDSRRERELRDREPPATAAEKGRHVAVDERRPEEFPGVRNADQREKADRGEVHALDGDPCLERLAGEGQRQARGETEDEDDREVAVAEDRGVSGGLQGIERIRD